MMEERKNMSGLAQAPKKLGSLGWLSIMMGDGPIPHPAAPTPKAAHNTLSGQGPLPEMREEVN